MDKEDVIHVYNRILLSCKKEWNKAICSKIDGPRDYHIKWSKSDNDKYHMISLICGIWKNDTSELRNRLTDIENKFMVTKEEIGERDKLGVWD